MCQLGNRLLTPVRYGDPPQAIKCFRNRFPTLMLTASRGSGARRGYLGNSIALDSTFRFCSRNSSFIKSRLPHFSIHSNLQMSRSSRKFPGNLHGHPSILADRSCTAVSEPRGNREMRHLPSFVKRCRGSSIILLPQDQQRKSYKWELNSIKWYRYVTRQVR